MMKTTQSATASSAAANRPQVDADHPWLGLHAYSEETQSYFFGRDAEIREIFTRVRENPLTTLFGQSGLGKSSLLGAGLIPKLRVEGYRPVLLRLEFTEGARTPLEQTRDALASALVREVPAGASLWEILHHTASLPADLREHPPVLIFDQFEEIFTKADPRSAKVQDWFAQIADLIENRPPLALQERFRADRQLARQFDTALTPARVVITLREDYLSHLEGWKGELPSLMRNRMALHRLTGSQALEAVIRPGSRASIPLVSETVGAQIVRKVARRPESTPLTEIEAVPPFLSLLCEQLNAARLKAVPPLAAITAELVDVRGDDILDLYYEESFQAHPPALRAFVEDRLVSGGGHRNNVPRDDAESELRAAGLTDPGRAIDALIVRRLLTVEERGKIPRLELTHDVLTPLAQRSRAARREQEALAKARRQRRLVASLTAVVLVFAGLAGFGWWSWQRAEKQTARAISTLSQSDFLQGCALLEQGNTADSMAYLSRAIRLHPDNTSAVLRLYSVLMQRDYVRPIVRLMKPGGVMQFAQFSPDGRWVITESEDNTAQVWDVATGKPISEPMRHGDNVMSTKFSPNGRWVVTASNDQTAQVWDAATGKPISKPMRHKSSVNSAQFSPDGRWVVTTSNDQTAQVWDATTGKPIFKPMRHKYDMDSAEFSPNGRWVVTTSVDNVQVWDAATGKPISKPIRHEHRVRSVHFSPDGRWVVTASLDHTAQVWDAATGYPISEPMRHGDSVMSAEFSPDGRWIVTASLDHTAQVWDAETAEPLLEMGHGNAVDSAQFSPDGRWVVTTSDGTSQVWDVASVQTPAVEPMEHGEDHAKSAQFSPDGRWVVTGSYDGTAQVCDVATGKPISVPMRHEGSVNSAQFSPDGRWVVTASADQTAQVWDAATGKPLFKPMRHKDSVDSAQFSPNGRWVVTTSYDQTAQVWDAATGNPISKPMRHKGPVYSAEFSPDGRWVVTTSEDQTAQVWDAATGNPISEPMRHRDSVYSAHFSPNGRWVVTASRGAMADVQVWDAITGKPISDSTTVYDKARSAQFSPDGSRVIISGGHITGVWVWDIIPPSGRDFALALAHIGEAVAQRRLNDTGSMVKLGTDEWLHLPVWARSNTRSREARQLADWLCTPRDKRPATPFHFANDERDSGSQEDRARLSGLVAQGRSK